MRPSSLSASLMSRILILKWNANSINYLNERNDVGLRRKRARCCRTLLQNQINSIESNSVDNGCPKF